MVLACFSPKFERVGAAGSYSYLCSSSSSKVYDPGRAVTYFLNYILRFTAVGLGI